MSTALTSEQQFQEKMKERMRAAMGELMPDDVLAEIVAKGINEAFFTKVPEVRNTYGSIYQPEKPSWCVDFIQKECERQTAKEVQRWIKENESKVAEILEQCLKNGLASAVVHALDTMLKDAMYNLRSNIQQSLGRAIS